MSSACSVIDYAIHTNPGKTLSILVFMRVLPNVKAQENLEKGCHAYVAPQIGLSAPHHVYIENEKTVLSRRFFLNRLALTRLMPIVEYR